MDAAEKTKECRRPQKGEASQHGRCSTGQKADADKAEEQNEDRAPAKQETFRGGLVRV